MTLTTSDFFPISTENSCLICRSKPCPNFEKKEMYFLRVRATKIEKFLRMASSSALDGNKLVKLMVGTSGIGVLLLNSDISTRSRTP